MINYYRIECGGDPHDDSQDDEYAAGFRDWFIDEMIIRIENIYAEIMDRMIPNGLPVWRAITAPRDWKPDPNRHPGYYWAWIKEDATAHWGGYSDGEIEWLMSAIAKKTDIDWPTSLAANAHPDYENEREIRIQKGVKIDVLSVEINR